MGPVLSGWTTGLNALGERNVGNVDEAADRIGELFMMWRCIRETGGLNAEERDELDALYRRLRDRCFARRMELLAEEKS